MLSGMFYILIVLPFVMGQNSIIGDGGVNIPQTGIQEPLLPQPNPYKDPLFWQFYKLFTSGQGANNPINAIRGRDLITPPGSDLAREIATDVPNVPQDIVGNNNVGLRMPGDPKFNTIDNLLNNPSRLDNMVVHRRNPALEHSLQNMNGNSNNNLLLTLALAGGSEGMNPLLLSSLLGQGNGGQNNLLQILALSGGGEGLSLSPLLLSHLLSNGQPQTADNVLQTLAMTGELRGLNPVVLQYLLQNSQMQQYNKQNLLANLQGGETSNAVLQQPNLLHSGQRLLRGLRSAEREESPFTQNRALLRQLYQSHNTQNSENLGSFPKSNIIPLLLALGGE